MVIQSATTLSPSRTRPSFPDNNLIKSMSDNRIDRPSPPPIRKLKSSLKISHPDSISRSKSDIFLVSPEKNVRFAIELTTVKRFDKNAEPSSISNENSPTLSPVDNYTTADDIQLFNNEDCWFNDSSLVTNLLRNEKKFRYTNSLNSMFKLDLYDSEDEDDIDDANNDQAGYGYTYDSSTSRRNYPHNKSVTSPATSSLASQATSICDWKLHCTDLVPFKLAPPLFTKTLSSSDFQGQLAKYLNGKNIKLHSLIQSDGDSSKIMGLIYVNNLSFEKYLEIKFTFNSWKDIHYVTANYNKTVNSAVDEFKFTIDLNSLKYILLIKRIITLENNTSSCPLNIELCCRYDVNEETFYDNNDGKNYHLFMTTFKKGSETEVKQEVPVVIEPSPQDNTATPSKTMKARFISSNPSLSRFSPQSRKFSEDTDYYNTSPLKHLYHNDTTTFVKPKRLNVVLDKVGNGTSSSPPSPPLAGTTKIDNATKNGKTAPAAHTTANNIDLPISGSQHQSLYSGSSSYSSSSSSISSSLSFASSNNSSTNSSSSASCSFPLTELDNFDYANLYEPNDTFTTANLVNHSLNSMIPDAYPPSFFGDFGNDNNNNNNLAASLDDSYEDKQSVITDTTMDDNNKTSTVNHSTDTLIKPSKENGAAKGDILLPTNRISPPSSSRNQTSTNLKESSSDNIELKYINYQSLLDSHRFHNHSSSPNLQPAPLSNAVSISEFTHASDVFEYEDENSGSNRMVGELDDSAFSPHFYLNEGNKSACLSDDALIDRHGSDNPFINSFSSSPPILSQEVDRWRH
ncbi:Gac1p [Saccharomyces cerevisiae x Saccharomyces kudriavzevii VIN7]|uniref:Gac1p n=1 Tax=Saccharomyces cerevisiae x Saccharomyces kudriavzevii (strain VIN7) TaxID=1095631 RepID=H0H1A0_SACCK|nr:Gac1p [Saccharomyces cerevisiae x Saccharomyces kudriavzevii VIN7]